MFATQPSVVKQKQDGNHGIEKDALVVRGLALRPG